MEKPKSLFWLLNLSEHETTNLTAIERKQLKGIIDLKINELSQIIKSQENNPHNQNYVNLVRQDIKKLQTILL